MPLTSTAPRSAVLEEIADQPARTRGDDDLVRLGQRLQTGGEVRCFPDDRLLLRRSFANQISDDHQPSGDADPGLQPCCRIEGGDAFGERQSRPYRAFRP